jgi:hypothetical protein
MHLPNLPTIYTKNGEERKVFFTVQARELAEMGWVEKGTEAPAAEKPAPQKSAKKPEPAPKPVVEEIVVEEDGK